MRIINSALTQAEKRMTDIFCLFFPLLAQIITVPSATKVRAILLQVSALGAKLQCDKTQVSVKRKRRSKVRDWSVDHEGADHH